MIKALIATVTSDEPTEVAQARRDQALELQEIQSAPPPSRPPLPPQHTATLPNRSLAFPELHVPVHFHRARSVLRRKR